MCKQPFLASNLMKPLRGFAVLLVVALLGFHVPARADSSVKVDVLHELERRKIEVRGNLNQIPALVDRGVLEIMRGLDAHLRSEKMMDLHRTFMASAMKTIEETDLPDTYSNLDVFQAMYRSPVDEQPIGKIVEDYMRLLHKSVSPEKDAYLDAVRKSLEEELNRLFEASQQEIAAEIDQVLSAEFEYWPNAFVRIPLEAELDADAEPGGPSPLALMGIPLVLAAVLAKVARKISVKITGKVTKKVGGKLAGKFVAKWLGPVGWALILGSGAHDLNRARSEIENLVREEFIAELKHELRPETFWRGDPEGQSARELVESGVREQLTTWSRQATHLVQSLLESALLLENPAFHDFALRKAEAGWSVGTLAEYSTELVKTFGPMIRQAPDIDVLVHMMALSRDRSDLRRLSDEFGLRVFELFETHGRELLDANSTLGTPLLASLIRENEDWRTYLRLFHRHLSPTASDAARRGLLVCIQSDFDFSYVGTAAFFEAVALHTPLFRHLNEYGLSPDKLTGIFLEPRATRLLSGIAEENPPLAGRMAEELGISGLARLGRSREAGVVVRAFQLAQAHGMTPDEFAGMIAENEDLLRILETHGKEGVELWFAYVGRDSGQAQKNQAWRALRLYEQGFPLEICMDARNLSTTEWFHRMPFGQAIYGFVHPLLEMAPLISRVLAVTLLVLILLLPFKWLGRKKTKALKARGRRRGDLQGSGQGEEKTPGKLPGSGRKAKRLGLSPESNSGVRGDEP